MDNLNTDNSDLAKQYQDILDRYSKELSATENPVLAPEITPEPAPEPISEPILTPPPEITLEPAPEPALTPPESTSVEPSPETITPSPLPPPMPVFESLDAPVPPHSNIFKYLFYLSLFIFICVALGIVYMLFFTNTAPSAKPSVTPTVTQVTPSNTDKFCEVNDKKYKMGESFPAADGCNTCSCGPDLTIVCTLKACEATPSVITSPTISKQIPKKQTLPPDLISFIKFQVIKQYTTPISEKDIVIGDSLLIDNYAQVAANGIVIWAYKKDGNWTYVTSGQEPPKCSLLTPLKFPTDFDCVK